MKIADQRGQATVEAVAVIPVLFLLLLMLMQPAIVLYDHVVMAGAASEGCRLLATKTSAAGPMGESCEAFIRHRLAAVPQHDCFHVHDGGCSWVIEFAGDEGSQEVTVRIANEVRPLPLFDAGARLLGLANEAGNLEIEDEVSMRVQPDWAASSEHGLAPAEWVEAWES